MARYDSLAEHLARVNDEHVVELRISEIGNRVASLVGGDAIA
jgi:hypothetical protein